MENRKDHETKDSTSKAGLDDFFSDLGDEAIDGDYDEIDQYIDEVMALLENYGDFSGGIITMDTIYGYLKNGHFPQITLEECFELISRLRTNHVIFDEITYNIPQFFLYVFKEGIQISEDMKILMKQFVLTPKATLTQLLAMEQLNALPVKALVMEGERLHLIAKEGDNYHFPGIPARN